MQINFPNRQPNTNAQTLPNHRGEHSTTPRRANRAESSAHYTRFRVQVKCASVREVPAPPLTRTHTLTREIRRDRFLPPLSLAHTRVTRRELFCSLY